MLLRLRGELASFRTERILSPLRSVPGEASEAFTFHAPPLLSERKICPGAEIQGAKAEPEVCVFGRGGETARGTRLGSKPRRSRALRPAHRKASSPSQITFPESETTWIIPNLHTERLGMKKWLPFRR